MTKTYFLAALDLTGRACLVVGVAVPSRENDQRAKDVRDRFIREVLPKVEVLTGEEPPERY